MIKTICILGALVLLLSISSISCADFEPKLSQKSDIVYSYEFDGVTRYCVAKEEHYLSGIGYATARADVVRKLGEPERIVDNWDTTTDDYYYDGAVILVGKGTNSVILMEVTSPRYSTPSGFRVGLTLEEVKKVLGYPDPFLKDMRPKYNFMGLNPCSENPEGGIVLQFNENYVVTEIFLGIDPP